MDQEGVIIILRGIGTILQIALDNSTIEPNNHIKSLEEKLSINERFTWRKQNLDIFLYINN